MFTGLRLNSRVVSVFRSAWCSVLCFCVVICSRFSSLSFGAKGRARLRDRGERARMREMVLVFMGCGFGCCYGEGLCWGCSGVEVVRRSVKVWCQGGAFIVR